MIVPSDLIERDMKGILLESLQTWHDKYFYNVKSKLLKKSLVHWWWGSHWLIDPLNKLLMASIVSPAKVEIKGHSYFKGRAGFE